MAARDRRVIRIAPYIAILWLTIIYSGAMCWGSPHGPGTSIFRA